MKKELRKDHLAYYLLKQKYILLFIALTGILYNLGMIAGPWFEGRLVQCLVDILQNRSAKSVMIEIAFYYCITIFFVQLMRYFKRYYVREFANRLSKTLKMELFNSILFQGKKLQEDVGTMMNKILSDSEACVEGIRKFTTEIFDTGVVMLSYLFMLFSYDWRCALLSLIFIPFAYLLAERLKKVITENVALSKQSASILNTMTYQRVNNALTYRLFGQETNQNQLYEKSLKDYQNKAIKANIWENAMMPIYQMISMLGVVFVLYFGSRNVLKIGWTEWDIAAFTTFLACYRKLAIKSSKAAKLFNSVQKARVSWLRIQPYLIEEKEVISYPEFDEVQLEMKEVSFGYNNQKPLFKNLSLKAQAGEIIGVSGPVACGKTTFAKLFTGELQYQGEIIVGKMPLVSDGVHYDQRIGFLSHQLDLFDGTIEENICLSKKEELSSILDLVCLKQEIEELPDGLKTELGAEGVRFSGGQKARIALARTLFYKKKILILDDPFASVDRQTEQAIFNQLKEYCQDCIVFLISHRLSLFPNTSKVLWIEQGECTVAKHEELLKFNENYRFCYDMQSKEATK